MSNTGKLRRNLLCSSTFSDPFSICACVWFEELIYLILFLSPEAIVYFSATGGKSHFLCAVGSTRSWVYFCISSQGYAYSSTLQGCSNYWGFLKYPKTGRIYIFLSQYFLAVLKNIISVCVCVCICQGACMLYLPPLHGFWGFNSGHQVCRFAWRGPYPLSRLAGPLKVNY